RRRAGTAGRASRCRTSRSRSASRRRTPPSCKRTACTATSRWSTSSSPEPAPTATPSSASTATLLSGTASAPGSAAPSETTKRSKGVSHDVPDPQPAPPPPPRAGPPGATAVVAALLVNIFERKGEERSPFVRLVDVGEDDTDPAKWGTNWPAEYDSYKRTALTTRTQFGGHGGSEAMPAEKIERDPWLKRMFLGYAVSIDYRDRR